MHEYKVTVYTQPVCQPCRFTKRKLTAAGVEFEERDAVQADNHAYITTRLGHQQAPVVTVHRDGHLWVHWSGLRPDLIADVTTAITQERAA
jgi:glutaredoxin-like protein NrdH